MAKVQIKSEKLTCKNTAYTSASGKSYDFNTAGKMNELLVNSLLATGQLVAGNEYDIDFDHQYIETEKFDAKPTYKKFLGYGPGVAVIGDCIVGIENRDGNTNVRFHQKDTLERIFKRLEDAGTRIIKSHCGVRGFCAKHLALRQTSLPTMHLFHGQITPIANCHVSCGFKGLDELRDVMRNFYSPLKDCEPMLRFVFMTGITKFSQMSIFCELNNITNISMDEPYAGICGITKEELIDSMSEDVDRLAEMLGLTRKDTLDRLTANYDGYHFAWPSPDVFNPYSLLCCFSKGKLGAYWFASGTPTYIINMMKKFKVLPTSLKPMYAKDSAFDAPTEKMKAITPLLYQSGYMTIKDYDSETELYTLDVPNKEIRVGLLESLLPNYLNELSDQGDVTIAQMSTLVKKNDIDGALQLLADFLETVPYCANTDYEGHYQQMFYIIFALLTHYYIAVEQHTANGRIDITIETDSTVYVMELKFNKSAQDALEQIKTKHYDKAFAMKKKDVVKVGLNLAVKDRTNILEWVIE